MSIFFSISAFLQCSDAKSNKNRPDLADFGRADHLHNPSQHPSFDSPFFTPSLLSPRNSSPIYTMTTYFAKLTSFTSALSPGLDVGVSMLFGHNPSRLASANQTPNSTLQVNHPSCHVHCHEGKIWDQKQRLFMPKVYARQQKMSKFHLDLEAADFQSAFLHTDSNVLEHARVSNVAHNNYNHLEKVLIQHPKFFIKQYELDYPFTNAKNRPPTATPWAKKLRTVLDSAKEKRKLITGWIAFPLWDALITALTFRMLGTNSALFSLFPFIRCIVCRHDVQLRDFYSKCPKMAKRHLNSAVPATKLNLT